MPPIAGLNGPGAGRASGDGDDARLRRLHQLAGVYLEEGVAVAARRVDDAVLEEGGVDHDRQAVPERRDAADLESGCRLDLVRARLPDLRAVARHRQEVGIHAVTARRDHDERLAVGYEDERLRDLGWIGPYRLGRLGHRAGGRVERLHVDLQAQLPGRFDYPLAHLPGYTSKDAESVIYEASGGAAASSPSVGAAALTACRVPTARAGLWPLRARARSPSGALSVTPATSASSAREERKSLASWSMSLITS